MRPSAPDGSAARVSARRAGLLGLLYLALTVALLLPFSLHLDRRAISPGSDNDFTVWLFAWDAHAIIHQPLHLFDANIMAPLPNTLAYEENGLGSALLGAPIIWLTGNVLLAVNVVGLLTIALSGVGVYLLARRLGVSETGSALAGLVFALDPPRFFRIEQFHVTAIQWIPFCLAYLHSYLDEGRRRDLWIALAFFSIQAVTSGHGTAFLMVSIVALLVYRFAMGEPIAPIRRLKDFGVVGALLLVPAVLIYLPYHRAQHEAGLVRDLEGWEATPPASFLATPSRIDTAILAHYPDWSRESPQAYLFPGYLLLLFVLAAPLVPRVRGDAGSAPARRGVWLRRGAYLLEASTIAVVAVAAGFAWTGATRLKIGDTVVATLHRPWRLWVMAAILAALRLMLARAVPVAPLARLRGVLPALQAWRRANRRNAVLFYSLLAVCAGSLLLGAPLGPWQFVYWIPPLSFIRAPLRFSLLVVLGLAVLAGFAFDRYAARIASRWRPLAGAIICALFVIEFSSIPLDGVENTREIPAIDRWLDTLPKPFTIAEVPLTSPNDDGSRFNAQSAGYMLFSTPHFQKTVHGFTGVLPEDHATLFDQLSRFPSEEVLRHLVAFHVNYVVVHGEWYSPEEFAVLDGKLRDFSPWLTLVHEIGRDRVYAIHEPGK